MPQCLLPAKACRGPRGRRISRSGRLPERRCRDWAPMNSRRADWVVDRCTVSLSKTASYKLGAARFGPGAKFGTSRSKVRRPRAPEALTAQDAKTVRARKAVRKMPRGSYASASRRKSPAVDTARTSCEHRQRPLPSAAVAGTAATLPQFCRQVWLRRQHRVAR